MGKSKIDKAVIRKYFWNEHSKAINWRHKIYKDFDKKLCKVYPGKAISIDKKAIVLTPLGKTILKKDFVADIKVGDFVTVHYDYVVEKITNAEFRKLWNKYK
jgi:hydrogenase maturation factor